MRNLAYAVRRHKILTKYHSDTACAVSLTERSIMKNIFSFKLYLQGLRKVRVTGFAMALIVIVMNTLFPIMEGIREYGRMGCVLFDYHIDAMEFAPCGYLMIVFAPLLVYNMFSYLNERSASDFYHSLPKKRACVFVSFSFSILTWILTILGTTALVNLVLWLSITRCTFEPAAVWMEFFGFTILALAMAGFMALSMTLTGTAVANFLVFPLLALFIRVCGLLVLYGLENINYMFVREQSWLRIFDFHTFLPYSILKKPLDQQKDIFLYWFIVAIILFVFSAVSYCCRKSESAAKSAPNRIVQAVFRFGWTFPFFGFGAYMLVEEQEYGMGALCICIGILIWTVFELLMTKNFKNLMRTLPQFIVSMVLAFAVVGSLYISESIFYARTPERDEIVSAKLQSVYGDWECALLNTTEVADPDTLDQVYEALEKTKTYSKMTSEDRTKLNYTYHHTITLTLRSGRKVGYNFLTDRDLREAFHSSDEYLAAKLSALNFEVEQPGISEKNAELFEALKSDFEAMSEEQKIKYLQWNCHGNGSGYSFHVNGIYQGQKFEEEYHLNYQYTPNAYRLYFKQYLERHNPPIEKLQNTSDRIAALDTADIYKACMEIRKGDSQIGSIYCTNPEMIKEFLQRIEIDSHLLDCDMAARGEIYRLKLLVERTDMDDETLKGLTEEEILELCDTITLDMYVTFNYSDIGEYHQVVEDLRPKLAS